MVMLRATAVSWGLRRQLIREVTSGSTPRYVHGHPIRPGTQTRRPFHEEVRHCPGGRTRHGRHAASLVAALAGAHRHAEVRPSPRDDDPRIAEINAYDAIGRRVYVVNPLDGRLDVIDVSTPRTPTPAPPVDICGGVPAGDGDRLSGAAGSEPNSVAIHGL